MAARTIVITGCSSGFGRATALWLAARNWQVIATVRKATDEASLRAEAETVGTGKNLSIVLADITRPQDVRGLHDTVAAQTPSLNALLNNAGTSFPAPLELQRLDDLRAQLEVNLVAHLGVTQALLPLLKSARGTLINVSSVGGRIAFPMLGAYHISKFGLEAMSDVLRLELAPFGVSVVVLEPGASPTAIFQTSVARSEAQPLGDYARLADTVRAYALQTERRGFPPEHLAALVERILESRRPRARYSLPAGVAGMIWLRKLLPDWAWDSLARRLLRW